MITLTLLHPTQSVPVQSWAFEAESVVRIGRSNDNDVIIYSAVVSRHHVELWHSSSGWEIINFGANGTYVENQLITQMPVIDGMVIRLGNSGPKLRIRVTSVAGRGPHRVPVRKSSLIEQRYQNRERSSTSRNSGTSVPNYIENDDNTTDLDI